MLVFKKFRKTDLFQFFVILIFLLSNFFFMKKLLSIFLLSFLAVTAYCANYYIHSTNGNDNNSGASTSLAWKSLAKANAQTFQPGDSIFLASGEVWFENFNPKGSGALGRSIVVTSYGEGRKPLLVGVNAVGRGVVSLRNQSYWEISNLEIVNNGTNYADRRGVEILGVNGGLLQRIYLKNLHIHHVKGILGNELNAKRTAGIYFGVSDDSAVKTRFNDVLIENCTIHDIVNQGIAFSNDKFSGSMYPGEGTWIDRQFTNFTVRNNVIYNISKNAMIIRMTDGGVVEHNVTFNTALNGTGNSIFSRNALRTVFQYNEGFLNKSHDHDGSFYDPDLNSPETIWRHSYSHDNSHGLLWLCTTISDSRLQVYNNISENDRGFLVYFNYAYNDVDVSNNIFLSGKHLRPFLIRENPSNTHNSTKFQSNVIINRSTGMTFEYRPELVPAVAKQRRTISDNVYFGNQLLGNYTKTYREVSTPRYLHRGFHTETDELDETFNLRPLTPTIAPAQTPEGRIVAQINDIPVYESELTERMENLKPYFYSLSRVIDTDLLRQTAYNELFLEKIQLEFMKQKGLKAGDVLSNLEGYFQAENSLRQEHATKSNLVFYGPTQFNFNDYRTYIWENAKQDLKDAMLNNEILLTDSEMRTFFQTGDLDRFDPKWASRGYDYSLEQIKMLFIDKKYDEFFQNKLANASIEYKDLNSVKSVGYDVKIYPNPTKDFFHISTNDANFMEFELFNLQGLKIKSSTEKLLAVEDVAPGLYIAKINFHNGFWSQLVTVAENI